MKRKLLFAMLCIASALGLKAQTDVTSKYIKNPGFEDCTPETVDKKTGTNIDYTSTGWTSILDAANSCGAVISYGSNVTLNGVTAPASDNEGNPGNALGISAGWTQTVLYKQSENVKLPAGYYLLSVHGYNNNPTQATLYSRFGFTTTEGKTYIPTNSVYPYGAWVSDKVSFYLPEETEGYFQIGASSWDNTSTNNAKVFFDNISLVYSEKQMDYTSSVSTTNWLKGNGTASGGVSAYSIDLRENYEDAAAGTKLYQDVTGLKNGIYTAVLYATSHNARGEGGATLNGTRDDVAYVFATSSDVTVKTFFTARGVEPGFLSSEPCECTITDIVVKDGTMRLGLGLEEANVTGWHTIQIKSLIRTSGLDLSGYIEAYQKALATAKTVAATTSKIAPSLLAALNATIDTYDEGKVDDEDADALEAAADALNQATNNANTSIASYALIASGTIPTNTLDGWNCENSNDFHVNTWSTEGNSDGTGMVTPFIENWVAKGKLLGDGRVYYTMAGLEPGEVYYAQALVRVYSEAGESPNGPNFFVNGTVTNMTEKGEYFEYNGMKGYFGTLGATATVGEDGTITLGVNIEKANYNWVAFKDIRIAIPSSATLAVSDAKYATFVAPFAVEIPAGVTASKVTGNNGATLVLEDLSGKIPAHTPVVLFSETAVEETVEGIATEGTPQVGLLTGVYEEKPISAGYVLQNQDGVVGFYLVDSEIKVPANRAYLTVEGGDVKGFFFGSDDATAVKGIEAAGEEAGAIYNLAGQRVEKAVKGVYIINGKKVLVK